MTTPQQHADAARQALSAMESFVKSGECFTETVAATWCEGIAAINSLLAEVERLTAELRTVTTERDHLYDQEWPWEWVVATREKQRREAAEALAERRGAAATLARSELDWCIGYASTVEHKAWRERLLKRLHVARAALARLSAGRAA